MPLQKPNKNLEREIYFRYTKDIKRFESLRLWVENSLNEMSFHDDKIFSVQSRVKDGRSFLKKIKKLYKNNFYNLTYEKILEEGKIRDSVGARLILLEPSSMPLVHAKLVGIKRFQVEEIKIHYDVDYQKPKVFSDIQDSAIGFTKKITGVENKRGYFGIHYIMKPKPIDGFYGESNIEMHGWFEIQLRTLMFHAWSDIQHEVYKSAKDKSLIANDGFKIVSGFINSCEISLANLVQEQDNITNTQTFDTPSNFKYSNIYEDIRKLVQKFDSKTIAISKRYKQVEAFDRKYRKELDYLLSDDVDYSDLQNAIILPEIAELYLKSNHYYSSKNIYEKLIDNQDNLGCNLVEILWIKMRYAQVCKASNKHISKAKKMLEDVLNADINNELIVDNYSLFRGAAYTSWNLSENELALNISKNIYAVISRLSDDDKLNCLLNHIYYSIEVFEENPKSACQPLQILEKDMETLIETNSLDIKEFNLNELDTVLWMYYSLYRFCVGDKNEYIKKAKYITDLISEKFESLNDDFVLFHLEIVNNAYHNFTRKNSH